MTFWHIHIPLIALCMALAAPMNAASSVPQSTAISATISGQLDVTLRHSTELDLTLKPNFSIKSTLLDDQLKLSATWDKDGPHIGPYVLSTEASSDSLVLWGGGQSQTRWADPLRLVGITGVNRSGLRMRLTREQWGIDMGSISAVRWENAWNSEFGKGKTGLLTLWGLTGVTGDSELDDEECDTETGIDNDAGCLVPEGDSSSWSSEPMHWQRLAVYGANTRDGLTIEGTLAWSGSAQTTGVSGSGWRVQYKQPNWSIEAKSITKNAGYNSVGSVATRTTVWRTGYKMNSSVVQLHRTEAVNADEATVNWRFYTGQGGSLSLDRSSSVFTASRVAKAAVPSWRLSLDWRPMHDTAPANSTDAFLWPDPSITYWKAVLEVLYPFGQKKGGIAGRLSIGENKAGKLNWSYPKLVSGRALSTQSEIAVCVQGLVKYLATPTWNIGIESTYGEEMRHKPVPGQQRHATFWSVVPSLERTIAPDLMVGISAGWSYTQEYTGARSEETLQMISVSIKL